jgi:basic membrane lipoprotein Med (substrate-binding protein (PBP1-ABC) superfamily)
VKHACLVATPLALLLLASGCGGTTGRASSTTTTATPAPIGLRVGVVGPLQVQAAGAVIESMSLRAAAEESLVLAEATPRTSVSVPEAALAHPSTHYALVGASAAAHRLPNLAGVLVRDDQAARLAGAIAGLAVRGQSNRRVAWVGPRDASLVGAFVQGVHAVEPGTTILRQWSIDRPAACKESALTAVGRGATVIMAPHGLCEAAALDGAHERNQPGLELSDFQLPNVAAAQVVRDAVHGRYHGGEDIVFGAASGAIAVRHLDPLLPETVAVQARAFAEQLASGRTLSG